MPCSYILTTSLVVKAELHALVPPWLLPVLPSRRFHFRICVSEQLAISSQVGSVAPVVNLVDLEVVFGHHFCGVGNDIGGI